MSFCSNDLSTDLSTTEDTFSTERGDPDPSTSVGSRKRARRVTRDVPADTTVPLGRLHKLVVPTHATFTFEPFDRRRPRPDGIRHSPVEGNYVEDHFYAATYPQPLRVPDHAGSPLEPLYTRNLAHQNPLSPILRTGTPATHAVVQSPDQDIRHRPWRPILDRKSTLTADYFEASGSPPSPGVHLGHSRATSSITVPNPSSAPGVRGPRTTWRPIEWWKTKK